MSHLPNKKIKIIRQAEDLAQGREIFRGNSRPVDSQRKKLSTEVDVHLKCSAPIYVVCADELWRKPIMNPVGTRSNNKFGGETTKKMRNVYSDYYKFNTNNHFVWTNQIIIGKDVEIENKDYFLNCEGKEYIEGVNYKNYNLKNPDKSFQLKKLEVLGHGLI